MFRNMGVVKMGRWLGWGGGHGRLMWLPRWMREIIVSVWNDISCQTFGHYMPLFQEKPHELPECCQCGRGVTRFNQRDVVRLWEID